MTARRWRSYGVATAGVVAILVIAAGVAVTANGQGGDPRMVRADPAAGPVPSPLTRPPARSPVAADAPQVPRIDLKTLRWTAFHGVQLPVSALAGPRFVRGGLVSGFADTPLGALLAAVNIAVRANAQWGPAIFGPTVRNQVTGPDARALLAVCEDTYRMAATAAGVPEGQPLGRAYVVEEAFRWETYTADDATVDIVSAGPGDQGVTVRAATRIEVQWRSGDWRVVAPPGGDWGNSANQISSLASYTAFPVPAT